MKCFVSGTHTWTHTSAFYHCNKTPETVNLNKEKRFVLAHTFGGSNPRSGGSVCSGLCLGAGFAGDEHMAKQSCLCKSRGKMGKCEKLAMESPSSTHLSDLKTLILGATS